MKKRKDTTEGVKRRPVMRVETDIQKGLSSGQVQKYRDDGWVNEPVKPPSKSVKEIIRDHPLTVSQVAMQAGIENAERYIDASTLDTTKKLQEAALKYTVFGRVTPEQKRQLVGALKNAGCTVAMTGDGVNDVLALKDADCSVAMASGCDAAAKVSQIVLMESDFSRMPSVVMEGRRVVNNIERSASLFLVKNIFSFLMAVFSVCFMINYPLEPAQISLITMFTIGTPAFLLAMQPNKNIIRGHFLPNMGRVRGGTYRMQPVFKRFVCRRKMSDKCIMLFVLFAILTEPVLRYGMMLVERAGEFILGKRRKKG